MSIHVAEQPTNQQNVEQQQRDTNPLDRGGMSFDPEGAQRAHRPGPFASVNQRLTTLELQSISDEMTQQIRVTREKLESSGREVQEISTKLTNNFSSTRELVAELQPEIRENLARAVTNPGEEQEQLVEALRSEDQVKRDQANEELANRFEEIKSDPIRLIEALVVLAEDPLIDPELKESILKLKEEIDAALEMIGEIAKVIEEYRKLVEVIHQQVLDSLELDSSLGESVQAAIDRLELEILKLKFEEELLKTLTSRDREQEQKLDKIEELEKLLTKIEREIEALGGDSITLEQLLGGDQDAIEALNLSRTATSVRDRIAALRSHVSL